MPEIIKVNDSKAYDMIKKSRIPTAPYVFVKKEMDIKSAMKKVGIPCVMKVSGNTIIHKTELNGIAMNIETEERALETFNRMMKIKGADSVVIQKQLEGIELIIGAKASSEFGNIISVGLGGIYVEVLKDVKFRIAPLTTFDAEAMVKELKGYEILAGIRGNKPINFSKLYEILVTVGRFAIKNKFKEMDINPLICNEEGCWAVDVRIIK